MSRIESYWQDVGNRHPKSLAEARLQLHYAAQVISAAADALLEPKPGGEHRCLEFLPEAGALVTAPVEASQPFRVGMSVSELELVVFDPDGAPLDHFELGGQTLADAFAWAGELATRAGIEPGELELPRTAKIPPHPLAEGGAFSKTVSLGTREIGRYFSNTASGPN